MFAYSDPTGVSILQELGGLEHYRVIVDAHYDTAAREPKSACTWLEALVASGPAETARVGWKGFPLRLQNRSADEIDRERFELQEEYVEWRVERNAQGAVERITFVTEFPEWFEALARVGVDAVIEGIRTILPGANPTARDLFGTDVSPGSMSGVERARRFRRNLQRNPWNNGAHGILCLSHDANTMGALFGLVSPCAVPNPNIPAGDLCGTVEDEGACVPGRASDPAVCAAVQELAQANRALALADPVGIEILELTGIWELDGAAIDINDPGVQEGLWTVVRGGRRAELNVMPGLRLAGQPITSGAQVARNLRVGASVVHVSDTRLPVWARTGNESLGRGTA